MQRPQQQPRQVCWGLYAGKGQIPRVYLGGVYGNVPFDPRNDNHDNSYYHGHIYSHYEDPLKRELRT